MALDEHLAVEAAGLGRHHKLALADSIVFATARLWDATTWTQDEDFRGLPKVEYRPHRKASK